MTEIQQAPPADNVDMIDPEVARQYAQYLELAGIAKLVSEESCWEQGTSSSVATLVVGNAPLRS